MRPPRILLTVFAALATLTACGDDDTPGAPALYEGEEYPGGTTTNTLLFGTNAFSRPVENITDDNELLFYSGNSFFNQAWVEAPSSTEARDGLGPLFNSRSCAGCHTHDGRGQPPEGDGPFISMLLRLSIPGTDAHGGPLAAPAYGGQLQPLGISGVPAEATPRIVGTEISGTLDDGTPYSLWEPDYLLDDPGYGPLPADLLISPRVAPQMPGMGLLEAIPEARLLALADPDDNDGDGISGRINMVWDSEAEMHRPGRFGWKAEAPSVRAQVSGAFLHDMGIASTVAGGTGCDELQEACLAAPNGGEPEISDELLQRVIVYSALLAIPARRNAGVADVLAGRDLFSDIGCAGCHTPSHVTGDATEFVETHNQSIWPYTDLLLHDMGEGLADGRPAYDADGQEWKTPPLWGIGFIDDVSRHTRFLHDGRARNLTEAILWHGGEAQLSRDAFVSLDADARARLILFLESL